MTNFDIDLNDTALRERLDGLKERGESDAVFSVGSNVEYGVFWSSGLVR